MVDDRRKTKDQLIAELQELRQTIVELGLNESSSSETPAGNSIYKKAFDASNLAAFVHRVEDGMPGAFIDVNPAACRLLGYSREELIGMRPRDLDADTSQVPPEYDGFLDSARVPRMERNLITKGGNQVSVVIDVQRFDFAGEQMVISFISDVTAKKQAETELRKEKQFTERILDTVPDTIFVFDPATKQPVRWNQAMRKVSGFTDEEIRTLNAPDDWYDPDDLAEAARVTQKVLETGQATLEMSLKTKDGRSVPTEYSAGLTTNEDGSVEYIIAVGRDITERNREALEQIAREQKLRAIYNNALAGIVTTDMSSHLIDVNQRWADMIGYSVAELKTMRITDFTHPDDIQSSKESIQGLLTGAVKQFSMVKRYIRKDGSEFWGEVHVSPIHDQDGNIIKTIALVIDITVRKLIEEELDRERNLFITGPIIVFKWATTEDWPLEYISPNVEEGFGYHPTDFTSGRIKIQEIMHPDDMEWVLTELVEFSQTDRVYLEQEYRIRDKQGNWRWLHDMTIAIRDETGQITHFLGYAFDITGRKQAEEDLRQSQSLFVAGPTVVFKWNAKPGWPVDFVSSNVTKQFGFSVEELTSSDFRFVDLVHPADLTRVAEEVATSTRLGRAHFEQEYRIRDKQGNWHWIYDLTIPIRDSEEEVSHYLGYLIDITERKQSEVALRESDERYQLVLASAGLGTWDWDIKSGAIALNERWTDMLGYGFTEIDHTFDTWRRLIHPDDEPGAVSLLDRHLAGSTEAYEIEFRMRHKSGHWIWVLTTGKVIAWDDDGNPTRMTGTHLDITERKNLEQQLRQTQKLEAIGTLAGGIAHDFNNILLSILGNAELAEDMLPSSNPVHEHLHEINIASRRAAELIKQLLAFSRPTSQTRGPVCIEQIIDEVLGIIRATLPANIQVERKIEASGLHTIADPTELHQVFLNLCTNAGQSMLEYGGLLEITQIEFTVEPGAAGTKADLPPGTYARIEIIDTGSGMPPEVLERIFEPFFTTREIGKGSGMGLAVVHGLIRSLNGRIDVTSKPNQGSVFTLYLPVVDAPTEPAPVDHPSPAHGSEHILLVDDEPQLVKIFSRMLGKLGYRVTAYTSSALTLDVFIKDPQDFDLLLTDQTMPEMSGAELAQHVTRIRPDLPVVLITGYSEVMPEERAAELGVTEYVMKPVDFNSLGKTIRKVLDGK